MQFGILAHDEVMRSVGLFAREVLPMAPEMLRASEARLDKGYPKAASIPSPADARPIGE